MSTHFNWVPAEKTQTLRIGQEAKALQAKHEHDLNEATLLQVELAKRARAPRTTDQALSFDSSMTEEQVSTRFRKLVQRSRDAVFA